jgi:hypothetical protein
MFGYVKDERNKRCYFTRRCYFSGDCSTWLRCSILKTTLVLTKREYELKLVPIKDDDDTDTSYSDDYDDDNEDTERRLKENFPLDSFVAHFSKISHDSHWDCYCKTQKVCGCGCDKRHDGW